MERRAGPGRSPAAERLPKIKQIRLTGGISPLWLASLRPISAQQGELLLRRCTLRDRRETAARQCRQAGDSRLSRHKGAAVSEAGGGPSPVAAEVSLSDRKSVV